jgi:hypothetical protein
VKPKLNFGRERGGKRRPPRRRSWREAVADGGNKANESVSVVGDAERPEPVARAAQLFAAAQQRIQHLAIAE